MAIGGNRTRSWPPLDATPRPNEARIIADKQRQSQQHLRPSAAIEEASVIESGPATQFKPQFETLKASEADDNGANAGHGQVERP